MTTGFIYLGIAVLSIWVGLAARRDQAGSREWKRLLRKGTTRDNFLFLAMPWGGLVPLSAGLSTLGEALGAPLLQLIGLLLVPFAAVGGLVAVFWGIFGWHPPLFMFSKWYRPIKAEDRERRRRERQSRKAQR